MVVPPPDKPPKDRSASSVVIDLQTAAGDGSNSYGYGWDAYGDWDITNGGWDTFDYWDDDSWYNGSWDCEDDSWYNGSWDAYDDAYDDTYDDAWYNGSWDDEFTSAAGYDDSSWCDEPSDGGALESSGFWMIDTNALEGTLEGSNVYIQVPLGTSTGKAEDDMIEQESGVWAEVPLPKRPRPPSLPPPENLLKSART